MAEYLTAYRVAKQTGISQPTIHRWASNGTIKVHHTDEEGHKYFEESVLAEIKKKQAADKTTNTKADKKSTKTTKKTNNIKADKKSTKTNKKTTNTKASKNRKKVKRTNKPQKPIVETPQGCISIGAYAKQIGVHHWKVKGWVDKGLLTPSQIVDGKYFFTEDQVDEGKRLVDGFVSPVVVQTVEPEPEIGPETVLEAEPEPKVEELDEYQLKYPGVLYARRRETPYDKPGQCPNYYCCEGWVKDPYEHSITECPYCKEQREKAVLDESVAKELDLPPNLTGGRFRFDSMYTVSDYEQLDKNSLTEVEAVIENLLKTLLNGELPKESMLFYLGDHCLHDAFVRHVVEKAVIGNLTVTELLDVEKIKCMRVSEDYRRGAEDTEEKTLLEQMYDEQRARMLTADKQTFVQKYNARKWLECVQADLSVVLLDAGAPLKSLYTLRGYMELRSRQNKPTIIITDTINDLIRTALSYTADEYLKSDYDEVTLDEGIEDEKEVAYTLQNLYTAVQRMDLARYYGVEYKHKNTKTTTNASDTVKKLRKRNTIGGLK